MEEIGKCERFDEARFNERLGDYRKLKREHPYYYLEWKTNGELARRCKSILDDIGKELNDILVDMHQQDKFSVRVCTGASFFPKQPWIGFFADGEIPTNGVYPVMGFYGDADGFFIGCTESFNGVCDFARSYCGIERCSEEDINSLRVAGLVLDAHLAKPARVFPFQGGNPTITKRNLVDALEAAISIYTEFRNKPGNAVSRETGCKTEPEKRQTDDVTSSKVYDWLKDISEIAKAEGITLVFRGQGDSCWGLESSLGIVAQYGRDGVASRKELRNAEVEAMHCFERDSKLRIDCNDISKIELLSLMQHYGSKTRLLDFTFSPLVALFWALSQRDEYVGKVKSMLTVHDTKENEPVFDQVRNVCDSVRPVVWCIALKDVLSNRYDGELSEMMANSLNDAEMILKSKTTNECAKGIDVVVPSVNNARISAQDGLFLMQRDIGVSFRENLSSALPENKKEIKEIALGRVVEKNLFEQHSVVKFVFDEDAENVAAALKFLGVSYKTIYPDLDGLAKSVTNNIVLKQNK